MLKILSPETERGSFESNQQVSSVGMVSINNMKKHTLSRSTNLLVETIQDCVFDQ